MELLSPRLRLTLLTPPEMRALLDGARQPGRRWAEGYPLDGTLVALAMEAQAAHEAGRPPRGDFGVFQVLLRDDDLVIGDVGFHGPPDELGEVGIGFGIVPVARGRGYAREALHTLLTWALAQPAVRVVHADTDLVNPASQRVLLAVGMHLADDDGDRKLYEIHA